MDFKTDTVGLRPSDIEKSQQSSLIDIVKEIVGDPESKLTPMLKGKVNRIIADCDLKHYTSLHKVSTADETSSTVLGFMRQTSKELTFEEQTELNQAFINKIQKKLPICKAELDKLNKSREKCSKLRNDKTKELKDRDTLLDTLQEQENEKMELMMEWLNHRLKGMTKFSDNSSELLSLKTKILDMKSKILHLQILQNIFTETNQSIKAYSEVHKDLKDAIKDTEIRIKGYKEIIESDM